MQDSPFNIKELEKQLQKITSGNTELVKLTIRLNEELKTKNIELQDIIESLPQGLIATDTQGVIVHFNKAVSEFTQIASKEARKKINMQKLLQKFYKMNQPLAKQQKYELLIEEQQLTKSIYRRSQELLIQVFNKIFSSSFCILIFFLFSCKGLVYCKRLLIT